MRGVHPDEFRQDLVVLEAQIGEPPPEHLVGGLGLVVRLGPGVDERADGLVAPEVRDGHLEHRRPWGTADALDPHAVAAGLPQPDGGEIGHAVGCDVAPGIPHLIDELLADRCHRNDAAGAGMLGDHEAAVGRRLDDGEAGIGQRADCRPKPGRRTR